ncbi:MAG: hydrolase [Desulfobulbaceae bacterium S5133MH15]|nr:MAG: hydrolase [Desulfobulbaceae bacterium S5133MH15]
MSNTTNRLTPENAALLLIDHQTGISNGITDLTQPEFKNNLIALAKIGKMFGLPSVITTSAANGPNGPLISDIVEILPEAPVIHRPGEINAWEHEGFVETVKSSGRKKLIMAGVSTDVCLAFAAVSAVQDGFDVYAVLDASGTWSPLVAQTATLRMVQAGVIPMTWVAVSAELQNDWRNPTGGELAELFRQHLPFYGNVMASFAAANSNN